MITVLRVSNGLAWRRRREARGRCGGGIDRAGAAAATSTTDSHRGAWPPGRCGLDAAAAALPLLLRRRGRGGTHEGERRQREGGQRRHRGGEHRGRRGPRGHRARGAPGREQRLAAERGGGARRRGGAGGAAQRGRRSHRRGHHSLTHTSGARTHSGGRGGRRRRDSQRPSRVLIRNKIRRPVALTVASRSPVSRPCQSPLRAPAPRRTRRRWTPTTRRSPPGTRSSRRSRLQPPATPSSRTTRCEAG